MEVICKEEQVRFTGGSGGYTWQQIVDAINSGDLSQLPAGTYVNSGGMFTYYQQGEYFDYGSSTNGFSISSGGYFDTGNSGGVGYSTTSNLTDCVFESMALLGELYGDYSLKFDSMKNNYNFLYSGAISAGIIKPASGGVDGYLLPSFVEQYFNRDGSVTTISQLSSFMAAGGDNLAIGTYSTGPGSGHAVVITGVTPDGTQFICTDAQNNNKEVLVDINCITGFVAITGACH
jgi:hypothetical protein